MPCRAGTGGVRCPPVLAFALSGAAVAWALPSDVEAWRAAGIVSAWAGTALLVASLVLMVREPGLAHRLGGLEAMMAWHHRIGVLAYVLLLIHPLCLALDAWQEQPARGWQLLAPWQRSWPVWIGWVGLVLLMLGLAATFARSVGYRRWRAWHQWLALGVGLGLAHVLVLLGSSALPLVVGAIALVALGWRLLITDRGLSALPYRVTIVTHPAHNVVEATLRPLAGSLNLAPGQFVLARFVDSDRYAACGEFHPFTVSGIDSGAELRVTIKALGACSSQVQAIAPGALVRLQGPFGNSRRHRLVTAALGGWRDRHHALHGILAPTSSCQQPTALLYLYRTPSDAAFLDELQALQTSDPMFQLLARGHRPGCPGPGAPAVGRGPHDRAPGACVRTGPAGRLTFEARCIPMVCRPRPFTSRASTSDDAIHLPWVHGAVLARRHRFLVFDAAGRLASRRATARRRPARSTRWRT